MNRAIENAMITVTSNLVARVPQGYCIFHKPKSGQSTNYIYIITGGEVLNLYRTASGTYKFGDVPYNTVTDFLANRGLAIFPVTSEVTGPCVLESKHKCCHSLYKTTVANGFIVSTEEIQQQTAYWTGGDYIINGKIVTYFPDQAGVDRFVHLYSMQ